MEKLTLAEFCDKEGLHIYLEVSEYIDNETGYNSYNEDQLLDLFDDHLNEIFGSVSVAGLGYATSRVLKEVDITAYRTAFNDWSDSEYIEDGEYYYLKDEYENAEDEMSEHNQEIEDQYNEYLEELDEE